MKIQMKMSGSNYNGMVTLQAEKYEGERMISQQENYICDLDAKLLKKQKDWKERITDGIVFLETEYEIEIDKTTQNQHWFEKREFKDRKEWKKSRH